jgi:hypothetical protein
MPPADADAPVILSFGEEWQQFRHDDAAHDAGLRAVFEAYIRNFPWRELPDHAIGANIGCGTGRWARQVAPRVHTQRAASGLGQAETKYCPLARAAWLGGEDGPEGDVMASRYLPPNIGRTGRRGPVAQEPGLVPYRVPGSCVLIQSTIYLDCSETVHLSPGAREWLSWI